MKRTMKRIVVAVILVLLMVMNAPAVDKTFTWDANTEADLAGYRLYQSNVSNQYSIGSGWIAEIPAGTEILSYNVTPDETYYFVLTAFDVNGNESGYSNEVSTVIDETAPAPPRGLQCN